MANFQKCQTYIQVDSGRDTEISFLSIAELVKLTVRDRKHRQWTGPTGGCCVTVDNAIGPYDDRRIDTSKIRGSRIRRHSSVHLQHTCSSLLIPDRLIQP